MSEKIKLAPSILSADFAHLANAVTEATKCGADYIHVDVMDGHFVPPITIGHETVKAIRKHTSIPLDVHLMIESPERQIENFARAGADLITVHVEACTHLHRVVAQIKESGAKAGVSLNPSTGLESVFEILPFIDLIVVMTVNPGYGGQAFIPEMLDKIARLRRILDERGMRAELEVDGGIKAETASSVVQAGGRVIVAGSAIFNGKESVAQAMGKLRKAIDGAV
ncbi:MAG: ribulose-phosphate 3-epimerase [Dehalococcoidia bacterium]